MLPRRSLAAILETRARSRAAIAPGAFAEAAGAPEITALNRDLPHRLVELVSERARRGLDALDSNRRVS